MHTLATGTKHRLPCQVAAPESLNIAGRLRTFTEEPAASPPVIRVTGTIAGVALPGPGATLPVPAKLQARQCCRRAWLIRSNATCMSVDHREQC